MSKFLALFLLIIALISISFVFQETNNQNNIVTKVTLSPTPVFVSTESAVLGVRTKTLGCVVNGPMQDVGCTPGAIFSVTKEQVCVKGYSSRVRNVPESEKNQVYAEYGIYSHATGQYEVDHLISLELGGSNDIANLWPEAAQPLPGFHQKDLVENYLHKQVCDGVISLTEAQRKISTDWISVYNQMPK